MDLKFYLSVFLRKIHYFAIAFVLVAGAGLFVAWYLPATYVAQSRLVVESEQMPGDLAASTVQADVTEQLQIIQQRILTRDRLLEMANRQGIYRDANGNTPRLAADDIVEDLRSRIAIVTTGGAANSRAPRQATLVTVSFAAKDPALSAAVTNEIVTMILRENVSMRTTVAGQTLEFFVQEVARLDREIAQKSAAVLKFKQSNFEALPDSLDYRRTQLAAQQERLMQAEREETLLKDRRARLVALFEATGRVDLGMAERPQSPGQRKLQDLQRELETALVTLSKQNPRVKMLEAQVAAQEKAVAAEGGSGALPGMSLYEMQLADLDGQLGFLAQRRSDLQASMAELERTITATPGNAVQLDTLERDYLNSRTQYDQAVASKARAETGDTIEALSRGQRISLIEPAVAPSEPTRPNRLLIGLAGIFGGLAAGLGLVVLTELLNRSIRRPEDLTKALGIQPFATLPLLAAKPRRSRKARRVTTTTATAVVLLIAALGVAGFALSRSGTASPPDTTAQISRAAHSG